MGGTHCDDDPRQVEAQWAGALEPIVALIQPGSSVVSTPLSHCTPNEPVSLDLALSRMSFLLLEAEPGKTIALLNYELEKFSLLATPAKRFGERMTYALEKTYSENVTLCRAIVEAR